MEKLIRIAAVAIGLLVVGGVAKADTVVVNWTNPTTNTNDTVIPASGAGSLQAWRVEYGTCNGTAFGTRVGDVPRTRATGGPALTTITINLDVGTSCVRVYTANTYGEESDASNVTVRVIAPPKPRPPVQVQAVVAGMDHSPVYRLTQLGKRDDRYSDACGFIEVGKACTGNVLFRFRDQSFRKVAASDVKAWGTNCDNAAAPCS
jgi:hypothetical protein